MKLIRSLHGGIVFVAIVCVLAALGPAVPAANAQSSLRNQIPIVAGTAIELPGARWCTAGAVLESRSWTSLVAPFARATRYVVMAKHCADMGEAIRVGDAEVGTVTWESTTYDVEIATVPPSAVQRPVCSGASQLHHCTIPSFTPRAVGRIVLNRGVVPQAVPVTGTGIPAADEHFCTSGAFSWTDCRFRIVDNPPNTRVVGQVTARSLSGRGVVPGDSGGPVASINGTLYGIIIVQGTGANTGLVGYLPIERIFQDLGYSYDIASA
ncbi:hypothetical protein [Rathayibacter iranicus]|uniref:Uncharacterized protein n=2 Tax=Rathayibacter iranicus TaxID=59737 RepID=A0AAD1EN87_9MICO|nr:hypothetical protein [Rathayibacter iranicus]AZZ56926.1 hypothetical protein C7V51_14345 [Rathayibacter iranicus]MWV29525.1 hypothetical protein [Rathayibacter iranicus NCPPB 2253 = VKM Ac-1602]PPI42440.1 hypothetical protein C5E09_13200 [Rathayibacter iranicus]PPI57862.1 hypothetical protein C5E08_14100 [Rathayibacter iranicus]PPI68800.1 hypothetical protein C5E01_13155 [Rathayibacter iranicus]